MKRVKIMPKWLLTILMMTLALCTGCGVLLGYVSDEPLDDAETPLLRVETTGGLCVYGGCGTDLTINRDGTLRFARADGAVRTTRLNAEALEQLQNAIARADFGRILSVPFNDICPIAYDGQQVIYTFYTDQGAILVDSCAVVVDPEASPFAEIHEISQQYYTTLFK